MYSCLTARICCSERTQSTTSQGKVQGWSPEETGTGFRESLPVGSLRTHSFLWQRNNTCMAFPTRSSLGTQCPRFWLESGHVNPLCLACFKFQTPRRTTGVKHKPLLDRQFRPSEPILSISQGTVRTVLKSKLPRNLASPGPDLQAGPSQDDGRAYSGNSFLHMTGDNLFSHSS